MLFRQTTEHHNFHILLYGGGSKHVKFFWQVPRLKNSMLSMLIIIIGCLSLARALCMRSGLQPFWTFLVPKRATQKPKSAPCADNKHTVHLAS
jgi:hypothetical protein